MSFNEIFCIEETNEVALIGSGYTNNTSPCQIVRPDMDIVWYSVLWKRNGEYRIFSAELLDKIYQLRKKKTKSVAMIWKQGILVDTNIGKILYDQG